MTRPSLPRRRLRRGEGPTGTELKTLYDTGVSIRTIARALGGWPYSTVHHRLAKAGTRFRPRGNRRTPSPEMHTDHPEAAR